MSAVSPELVRRNDAVLVIVDVQERLAAAMALREKVIRACVRLARAATLVGVPIVATRQYPQGLGSTEEVLESVLVGLAEDGARVLGVDKTTFDCTAEPEFVEALAATARQQVVLVGMETHICVTQTALSLVARGFDVHVAGDGCCSRDAGMHALAIERMRAAGAVVTTSESVMYELVGRAATDEFRALLAIVKD